MDRMAQRGADVRLSINAGKADRENTKSDLLRIVEELLDRGYQSQHYSKYVSRQRLAVA